LLDAGADVNAAEARGMAPQMLALTSDRLDPETENAYRKVVKFLVATQAADGSWHVASRAAKIQPYFESGFPYGHDQWISAMGTGRAANALARAFKTPRDAE
jgi:hypothetical protein